MNKIKGNTILLVISSAMMELSWIYALCSFFFLIFDYPIIPLLSSLLAFFAPIIIKSIIKGRGKKVFEHIVWYSFFYLLILLFTTYLFVPQNEPFFGFKWLNFLWYKDFGPIDGLAYIILFLSFNVFWFSGYRLTNRSANHLAVSSRFDLGIAMLALTFIISEAAGITFPNSNILIYYYFIFGIFAIIQSQNFKNSKIQLKDDQSKTGLIFSVLLLILLLLSWLLLLFLPQMVLAARTGYEILKTIGNPIGNFLLMLLSKLYGLNNQVREIDPTGSIEIEIPSLENKELTWLEKIMQLIVTWAGVFLFAVLTILTIGYLFYLLWTWFTSKTELDIEKKGFLEELLQFLKYVYNGFKKLGYKFYNNLLLLNKKSDNATIFILFHGLCQWGKNSGLPKHRSQTPLEYGKYLGRPFPKSYQDDINLIINSFNRELYGKKHNLYEDMIETKKAWKRLTSPSRWPFRLKTKLIYSRKMSNIGVNSS